MKSFVASLILAGLIIIGGIWSNIYMDDISERMYRHTEKIEEYLEKEDFKSALEKEYGLYSQLDYKKKLLATTIDHTTIDSLERNLFELISYTKSEQSYDALAKCEVLKIMIKQLPRNYSVKLENVL